MPEARFTLLCHNSTVESVFGQVLAARQEARTALERGEAPHMLAIDSWSTCWELIKSWTYRRMAVGMAAGSDNPINPNQDVSPGRNLWNDARARYRQFMTVVLSWPGPVVLTCRAEWVSGTNEATGQPTKEREYSIEAHRSLKYDATVIIRMNRGTPHQLWKCRSIHHQIDPDDPAELETIALGDLVFDAMRYDPHNAPTVTTDEPLDPIPEAAPAGLTVIGRGQGPKPAAASPPALASPSASMPASVDWAAELARIQQRPEFGEPDWEAVYTQLQDLWTAASFRRKRVGDVAQDVLDEIGQAGARAKQAMWRVRLLRIHPDDQEGMAAGIAEARAAKVDVEQIIATPDTSATLPVTELAGARR